jgi:hypothetical protein
VSPNLGASVSPNLGALGVVDPVNLGASVSPNLGALGVAEPRRLWWCALEALPAEIGLDGPKRSAIQFF